MYYQSMRLAALVLLAAAVALQAQAAKSETTPPQVIRNAAPEYTDEARNARAQGTVVLTAQIGTDGIAHDIRVLRHMDYGLDDKAVECLRKWLFQPGTRNGVPGSMTVTVEINFRVPAK
jgi:periplasmic protein TonB